MCKILYVRSPDLWHSDYPCHYRRIFPPTQIEIPPGATSLFQNGRGWFLDHHTGLPGAGLTDRVPLNHQVKIKARPVKQQVAHETAHNIEWNVLGVSSLSNGMKQSEQIFRH